MKQIILIKPESTLEDYYRPFFKFLSKKGLFVLFFFIFTALLTIINIEVFGFYVF